MWFPFILKGNTLNYCFILLGGYQFYQLKSILVIYTKLLMSARFKFIQNVLVCHYVFLKVSAPPTYGFFMLLELFSSTFSLFFLVSFSGDFYIKLVLSRNYVVLSFISWFYISLISHLAFILLPFTYLMIILIVIYFKIFCNCHYDISWTFEFFRDDFFFQMCKILKLSFNWRFLNPLHCQERMFDFYSFFEIVFGNVFLCIWE